MTVHTPRKENCGCASGLIAAVAKTLAKYPWKKVDVSCDKVRSDLDKKGYFYFTVSESHLKIEDAPKDMPIPCIGKNLKVSVLVVIERED